MAELDVVVAQFVDLGRRIINQGIALRKAADNITPDQFARTLAVAANAGLVTVQASGFEFEPPPGEFRGDVDRIEWVRGRLTVIREFASLDVDAATWLRGGTELEKKAGGSLSAQSYHAVKDEIEKLRAWTVPAADYARANLGPVGSGSGIAQAVVDLLAWLGLSIDKVGAAVKGTAEVVAIVAAAIAALLIAAYFYRK